MTPPDGPLAAAPRGPRRPPVARRPRGATNSLVGYFHGPWPVLFGAADGFAAALPDESAAALRGVPDATAGVELVGAGGETVVTYGPWPFLDPGAEP